MIEVKNLCKAFGKQKVLDSLSLSVKKASVYGLVGPNGAGKTTLIKHLTGIYRPDKGTAAIGGRAVYDDPGAREKLYYIPDELYFFGQYTIEETARFYEGLFPAWNRERFGLLKKAFPIDPKKRIAKLSKGMQKQVAFWLGICAMPEVMIMDEPVDGLDPVMRRQVWNLVLQDVAEREMTVLVSSHNLRELEDVCDCVGILHQGRIAVDRELDDMKSHMHKLQVAFSGEVPPGFLSDYEILSHTQKGSIHFYIIRGEREGILSGIKREKPAVLDLLPLSLEEIFINELGGMGYEVENIVI